MSGNDSRLSSLVYKMQSFFRKNSSGEVAGLSISKEDLRRAASPDNVILGTGVKRIIVSTSAPVSPEVGDIWIDLS